MLDVEESVGVPGPPCQQINGCCPHNRARCERQCLNHCNVCYVVADVQRVAGWAEPQYDQEKSSFLSRLLSGWLDGVAITSAKLMRGSRATTV